MENKSNEISWLDRIITRFKETGILIPTRQQKLYEKIRDHFAGGRTCVDVGCSIGVGSNILSQEARFVWGLDVNKEAIQFATLAFKRPNLDFAVFDIENPPTQEVSKFELIVASEILEHLANVEEGLISIKRLMGKNAIVFITCPNGNNKEVIENENKHGYHLQHWKAGEFYELMTKNFQAVTLYSVDKLEDWEQADTVDGNTEDYLLVAKCEGIK